ncbi:DNA repair protein RadC [Pseudorhodobacter sp. MZDSW-24AT]|uniref:DNA repair protein RadC n=1 Tax=Pseudorhodobacter sp. MZDSW-24AT TaxID=2052957 RepID=UPI000C1EE28B|nr:DNA repair protein RadC [Pseudorhodobacter sp. MZDSW-24AT]PJF10228.1 DNA repair protein RadC [Pseudorhodobacter sp. MZDSW-24AT]
MFDLPLPIHSTTYARVVPPHFSSDDADHNHPFALTLSRRAPADLMSGRAAPLVLAHFATLAVAMQGAIDHAEGIAPDAAPQLLAILDRDERLVLAGAASDGAVAWSHPVISAAEARGVVTEASQLRALACRTAAWCEPYLAERLRHRADLLDGRLVDPLWRAFAARALQVAA